MSDQGTFEFIKESPRPRPQKPEYVFFALLAREKGEEIAGCRDMFMRQQGIVGAPIARERLHISLTSLNSFGRIPSWVPFGAKLAADRIRMSPFEVTLDRGMTWQGGRPGRYPTVLLAKSDALQELGDDLYRELGLQGIKAGKLVNPHMTMSYGSQSIQPVIINPIRLLIDRFYLIHSERGLSRYNILGEWPLRGPNAPASSAAVPPLAFGSMAA